MGLQCDKVSLSTKRKADKMSKYSNEALLAKYLELVTDENSNDAELGVVVLELEARGL